jgi:UDP-N-acetylglucosamine:LPS N-acetylglucosamine transferase
LTQATVINSTRVSSKKIKRRKSLKDYFKFRLDWSQILSAIKSMLIIGVGSIFVMVPSLANTFANGQWILIGLCMTQGDTVGGAFTTMKMRLVGTLLGRIYLFSFMKCSFLFYFRFHVGLCNLFSSR